MIKLAILPLASVPILSDTPNISAGISVRDFNACVSLNPWSIAVRRFVQKSRALAIPYDVMAKRIAAFSIMAGLFGASSQSFNCSYVTFRACNGSSTSNASGKVSGIMKLLPVAFMASIRRYSSPSVLKIYFFPNSLAILSARNTLSGSVASNI